ncbi:glycoside hydrolase family 5 protein [Clostridium akagii]|uniref:glycoside hydrolase family 5 protein n=1 Tax=Clostridium akagii TaxID=91623 RepID=UPI00047B3239|nr:glycoside hydrolase family 5 protein [Clostridium akagii]
MKKKLLIIALLIVVIVSSVSFLYKSETKSKDAQDEVTFNRCMNIGNALEAPKGQKWDVTMNQKYFDVIKKAGFDSVRLPVRFSDYAKNSPNYTLDENFMKKIDGYVKYGLNDNLVIILDFHHFIEIMNQPEKYRACFLGVWSQLATRYKNYPKGLVFELLNEPKDNLKGELWNEYIREGVATIRKKNPTRKIIVGPDNYYSVDRLKALSIPKDKNIIVSFHYYDPNDFTFQANQYLDFQSFHNIPWDGTKQEVAHMKGQFDMAKQWADKNNVHIFLGEFGANKLAPANDRELWTEAVRKQAENHDFSWGYWELCSEFGIYNANDSKWDYEMLKTLIPKK